MSLAGDDSPVYYCAYGSNMSQRRLMAYIQGGTIPHRAGRFRGCVRSQVPPSESFVSRVPHRLTFAGDCNSWGGGGVAFLDPSPLASATDHGAAIVRCYLMTFGQLREIVEQENGDCELADVLPATAVLDLPAGAAWTVPLTDAWYNRLIVLGRSSSGIPMLTFTCPPEHLDATPFAWPSRAYASSLLAGLIEGGSMEPDAALSYLLHVKGHGRPFFTAAAFAADVPALARTAEDWLVGRDDDSRSVAALAALKAWRFSAAAATSSST